MSLTELPSPTLPDLEGTELSESRRRPPGRRGWLVRRALLASDVAGLALAALVAEAVFGNGRGVLDPIPEFLLFLATIPLWVVGAKLYGLYDNDEERTDHSTADELVTFFHFVTVGAWGIFIFGWATSLFVPNPNKLGMFWLLAITLVGLGRTVARTICRRQSDYIQNVLIVGADAEARLIARKLLHHPEYGVRLIGFVRTGEGGPAAIGTLPVLGGPENLVELVECHEVERVVLTSEPERDQLLEFARVLNERDIQVDVVPKLYELVSPGVTIHTVEGVPLLALPPFRLGRTSSWLKRGADIVVSALALALLSPLLALIAIAIRTDSRGPIFFKQIRRGAGNSLFLLCKFRTMVADADQRKEEVAHLNIHARDGGDPRMFKIEDDPRVTRVGRFLRRYLLDELPQLWNVLRGEMSLVGPRPLILDEDRYVEAWARKRLELKPGMTGLWQVLGRQAISFDEMIKLDYLYVTTWSFGGDFRLLLRTIPLVLKGDGGSY